MIANVAFVRNGQLSIKDHKFEPAQIKVAAGKAIELIVDNRET